jgi:hypothetical protein
MRKLTFRKGPFEYQIKIQKSGKKSGQFYFFASDVREWLGPYKMDQVMIERAMR